MKNNVVIYDKYVRVNYMYAILLRVMQHQFLFLIANAQCYWS